MIIDFKKIERKQSFESWQRLGRINVKVLTITSVIVLILALTQLVFANHLATDGQKLTKIEDQIQKIEAENTTLRVQIAKESSFSSLLKKAKVLGFGEPLKVLVVHQ